MTTREIKVKGEQLSFLAHADSAEKLITGVATGETGTPAIFKVKGTYLYWNDYDGNERRREGTLTGNSRTAGSITVHGELIYFGDDDGAERYVSAAVLYENYNTGDDDYLAVYGVRWWAQTFTVATAHTIASVKLLVYKVEPDDIGIVTVSIKATDGSGHPTGADLTSGTFDPTGITDDTDGEWKEIVFSTGYALSLGVKYAIVVRAPDSISYLNYLGWRCDSSSPTYTDGNAELNASEGDEGEWIAQTDYDFMFECWG